MPPTRDSPAKRWCFTLNNYTDAELAHVLLFFREQCSYGIVGREVGEGGTPHLQGYFILQRKLRLRQCKDKVSERAHFESARGTPAESRVYCAKDGQYDEVGVCPGGGGSRSRDELAVDFEACARLGNAGLTDFKDRNPGTYFFSRHTLLRNYLGHGTPVDRPDVVVKWIYGPPGVGKSRDAHAALPNAFIKDPVTKWWTGYLLEKDCIIDDFGPRGIGINHLLRWFDRYKCYVESKGDVLPLHVDHWIVTSNFHPSECFKSDTGEDHPQLPALLRRMQVVHYAGLQA